MLDAAQHNTKSARDQSSSQVSSAWGIFSCHPRSRRPRSPPHSSLRSLPLCAIVSGWSFRNQSESRPSRNSFSASGHLLFPDCALLFPTCGVNFSIRKSCRFPYRRRSPGAQSERLSVSISNRSLTFCRNPTPAVRKTRTRQHESAPAPTTALATHQS